MNRFFTFAAVALGVSVSVAAQSKFDAGASLYMSQAQENVVARKALSRGAMQVATTAPEVDPERRVATMVCMRTPSDVALLEQEGYEVQSVLGRIATVMLTPDEMEAVAAMDETVEISLGYGAEPMMISSRTQTGVADVHSGTGLSHGYTGKGVVVGMMDTGLDVGHLNFRDADKKTRMKRLWVFQGTKDDGEGNVEIGTMRSYTSESEIENFISSATGGADTDEGTHATHVLGIMAGSFDSRISRGYGGGYIASLDGTRTSLSQTGAMPYYGVAKEAEIAACCGTLHDPCIITAAQSVLAYANEVGKPAVFNLSLGNNVGPHDGTDNASEALAEAGKSMLICISAGNEGSSGLWAGKQFSGADNSLKTCFSSNASTSSNTSIDIWGDKSERLKVRLVAVDASGRIAYSYEIPETSGATRYMGGSGVQYSNVEKNAALNPYFGNSGYFGYRTNLNAKNNRYNVTLYPHLAGGNNGYYAALVIEGSSGNGVNAYCRNLAFQSNNVPGFVGSTGVNTINGMACGENVLVVGAYVANASVPVLNLNSNGVTSVRTLSYQNATSGALAAFSSSGKTFQGRQLPDVVGPGQGVIASYSKFFINANKGKEEYTYNDEGQTGYITSLVYTDSSKKTADYWCEMSGTSMSSPFVAGVLALWSQAAAEKGVRLSMDDVKKVIAATADKNDFTAQQPERWGMGKINALAGLKYILANEMGGVDGIASDDPESSLIIEPVGGGVYSVFLAGVEGFTATLHNLQGQAVATASATGNELTLDGSALGRGVYVLTVQAPNTRISRKIAL